MRRLTPIPLKLHALDGGERDVVEYIGGKVEIGDAYDL
jgi:hypothetical protein